MILETFTDTWNFTFLIAASISVLIGSYITIRKMKKEEFQRRHEKRNKTDNLENTNTIDKLIKNNNNIDNNRDINN